MENNRATTQPLDAMPILLSQLERIERSIASLPGLLARIEALTEVTRQLENTLRETSNDLRSRDESQQKAIDNLALRVSQNATSIAIVSGDTKDIERKVNQLPIPVIMKAIREEIPKERKVIEQQAISALEALSVVNSRIRKLEDLPSRKENELSIMSLSARLDQLETLPSLKEFENKYSGLLNRICELEAQSKDCIAEFVRWRPWLSGIESLGQHAWKIIVPLIILGLVVAVVQSGVLIP